MSTDLFEWAGYDLHALLTEKSTPDELEDNIVTAFPHTKRRQHIVHEVNVKSIEFIPFVGMNTLHVRSTTDDYKQAIQFNNVQYVAGEQDGAAVVTDSATNAKYWFTPIQLSMNLVKVRCSCLDFRFRFAAYNNTDKSLVGRPPPRYVRKTTTRPSVNPTQVPGMCKHLLRVLEELQRDGVLV